MKWRVGMGNVGGRIGFLGILYAYRTALRIA